MIHWTAGRIRRESYTMYFGEMFLDVDELRTHFVARLLRPILEKLSPLTDEEVTGLRAHFQGFLPKTQTELELLF
jgi:hypothetical protein